MDQNTRRTVSICFQVDYAPVGAGAVRSGVGTLASPWCLTSPQILFDYAPVGAGAVRSGVGTLASPWCLTSPGSSQNVPANLRSGDACVALVSHLSTDLNWNHLDVESEAICA